MHARERAGSVSSVGDGHQISMSRPSVGEAGNTGDWRAKRPVVDAAKCLAVKQGKVTCQICWVYCPDGCIAQGVGPTVDLTYCKGCGICAEECPAGAITMVSETEPGACALDDEPEETR
jgi:pyruvate ferredoxin oxidoreductase delta subunit